MLTVVLASITKIPTADREGVKNYDQPYEHIVCPGPFHNAFA